mmetsp:Transcript_56584/g.132758  ORF Transcript_56584/g.132758 Transcript_56584/m.132758 type:complete len:269 (+) Transcript_56584:122-928(+)
MFSKLWDLTAAVTPLQADLRRITENDHVDIPKDALLAVMQASFSPDSRKEIMAHVQDCLTSKTGWRRVHCGLELLDHLLRHGAPQLMREAAEGTHFDVVQRLSFLENFSHSSDKRVEQMVRKKATTLRRECITRMESMHDAALQPYASEPDRPRHNGSAYASTQSTDSQNTGMHNREPATPDSMVNNAGGSPSWNLPPPRPAANRQTAVVNNLVMVGHRDDTSSDSDANEGSAARKKGRDRKPSGVTKQEPAPAPPPAPEPEPRSLLD